MNGFGLFWESVGGFGLLEVVLGLGHGFLQKRCLVASSLLVLWFSKEIRKGGLFVVWCLVTVIICFLFLGGKGGMREVY